MTSAGLATVTATLGNLTASATITVVTGTLPAGTVRWTSAPGAPGAVVSAGPLFANRAEASIPDLYVLENTPAGSQLLHGVFADGTPGSVWTVSTDSSSFVYPSLADRHGGAILDISSWSNGFQQAFVRIPGTADGRPWRDDPSASGSNLVGQSPEGTVYLIEPTDYGYSAQIVGLDGETGDVRFRYTPPGTNYRAYHHQECNALSNSIWESGAELSHAVVGYDGALYAFVLASRSVHDDYATLCPSLPPSAPEEQRATLSVARVSADGAASIYELQTVEGALAGVTLVPDPRGGVHAEWSSGPTGENVHVRVGPDVSGAVQSGSLPFDRIGDRAGSMRTAWSGVARRRSNCRGDESLRRGGGPYGRLARFGGSGETGIGTWQAPGDVLPDHRSGVGDCAHRADRVGESASSRVCELGCLLGYLSRRVALLEQ